MSRSAKIKVLQVIRPAAGGMREHLKSLLLNLDRERYELSLAGPVDELIESLAHKFGITVFRLNLRGELAPLDDLKAALKLGSILRQIRPDIVHAHGSKAGLLVRLACLLFQPHRILFPRLPKPEIVITLHNLVYTGSVTGPKMQILQAAERLMSPLVRQFIAVSRTLREEILAYQGVNPEGVVTIYNGLDLHNFCGTDQQSPDLRSQLGLGRNSVLIGTVARLAPQKGVEYFVRMASLLASKGRDLAFLVVGDGPLRMELQELAETLPGEPRIHFVGSVSQIQPYLAAMDIFVLASISEGLGISVLEAMAMQKPVVATRVGGIPEIVESHVNGLLVPPCDAESLAAGVDWLLDHRDQAAELAKAGYHTVKTKFTLETMIKDTEKIYEQILQDAPGGELDWQPR